jgi:hypothetical protein
MTLTIKLTPDEEARLSVVAKQSGLDVAECARRLLIDHIPPIPPGQATLELLRAWREEEATGDPEEIRAAEEELQELKDALDANRAAVGARPLFP